MAYSTESDILERIEEATLVQLTDRSGNGEVDSSVVSSAIEDADALINSLISPLYQVPLASVPRVIREHSANIAIYRLHLFRSVDPGVWKDAFKSTLEFLQMVAERRAALEGVAPKPDVSETLSRSIGFSSEERKFSREKLREW